MVAISQRRTPYDQLHENTNNKIYISQSREVFNNKVHVKIVFFKEHFNFIILERVSWFFCEL